MSANAQSFLGCFHVFAILSLRSLLIHLQLSLFDTVQVEFMGPTNFPVVDKFCQFC